MAATQPSDEQRSIAIGSRSTALLFPMLGIGFAAVAIGLWSSRPPVTGSPLDPTYPVVLISVVVGSVLCFIAAFRFPIGFLVTPEELKVRYVYRVETIPSVAIRNLQVRGGLVQRNVWIVLHDGSERPLGTRSANVAAAWRDMHPEGGG